MELHGSPLLVLVPYYVENTHQKNTKGKLCYPFSLFASTLFTYHLKYKNLLRFV